MTINESMPILVQSELEGAGSYLNAQANDIAEELSQLASYVSALPEVWQGQASDYYQGLQGEWNIAANGLFGPDGVLGEIARAMNATWGNYCDAEWTNELTWRPGSNG